MAFQPFLAFARSMQRQSRSGRPSTAACDDPKPNACRPLIEQASRRRRRGAGARTLAIRLVEALRAKTPSAASRADPRVCAVEPGGRGPDVAWPRRCCEFPTTDTRDALIRDKIGGGDWRAHLGHSPSPFVNAATWGLAADAGG